MSLSQSAMEKESNIRGHETPDKRMVDDESATSDDTAATVWEAYYSEKHQREYFYNPTDQTVSWFAPSVLNENDSREAAKNQVMKKSIDSAGYGYHTKPTWCVDKDSSQKSHAIVFLVIALVTRQLIMIALGLKQELIVIESEPVKTAMSNPVKTAMSNPSIRPVRSPAMEWRGPIMNRNISYVHEQQIADLAPELAQSEVAADLKYQISMSWELNDGMPNLIPTNELSSMGQCLRNDCATTKDRMMGVMNENQMN